jgi:restriction endonuclease Mrr
MHEAYESGKLKSVASKTELDRLKAAARSTVQEHTDDTRLPARDLHDVPIDQADLAKHEAKRDLAAELLQSVREMKAGQVQVVALPAAGARKK